MCSVVSSKYMYVRNGVYARAEIKGECIAHSPLTSFEKSGAIFISLCCRQNHYLLKIISKNSLNVIGS